MAKPNCPFLSIDHNFPILAQVFTNLPRFRSIRHEKRNKFNRLKNQRALKKYFVGEILSAGNAGLP
jgi:hypothetical protein